MFILSKEKSYRESEVIGIFDLDSSTVSAITKNFLSVAEKANKIKGEINNLPKNFILVSDKKNNGNIYFSAGKLNKLN